MSTSPPNLALIMKGGGVKGLAYIGAIEELEKTYEFNWFVGTSAGAIAAALLGAGYTTAELDPILREKDFNDFFDAKPLKACLNLLFKHGLYEGTEITNWLDELLAKKLRSPSRVMLSQLKHRVTIFASRRETAQLRFDPVTNDVPAAYAVRCSMAYPLVFTPQVDQGWRTYDGGLRNNYPVQALLSEDKNIEFISLFLGNETYVPVQNNSVINDLLAIWIEASDLETVQQYRDRTVIIDTQPIDTLDFGLSALEKDYLVACGKAGALDHLSRDSSEHKQAVELRDELKSDVEDYRAELVEAKQQRRKRILHRCLISAAILIVALAAFFTYQNWPRSSDISFPAYMTAYEARQDNPAALSKFRQAYVGRRVIWDGVVIAVQEHESIPSLKFAPTLETQSVRATFDVNDFEEAAALETGTRIRIQGRISNASNVGTYLEDCKLVRILP